jgi:trans-o-hydroxybenzylidenepyruvate hydratase-aldolase
MLTAQDIRGLYAIMPTPAKEGAERLTARNTVDLDETERVVNALIRDGSSGLIALGTTGECATLSQEDYEAFVNCFLEVTNKRVPTFVGASALGGHEVAKRMEFIRKRGADGTLLGLPMWQPLTVGLALDFYREISTVFPEVAVMAYANQRAFRFSFPDDFWEAVIAQAPTIVAAKYSRPRDLKRLIEITRGRVNIVPNEMTIAHFYATAPDTTIACWATAASMGPAPTVAMMDAVLKRDEAEMKRINAAMAWANAPIKPVTADPEVFAMYNIQVEKTRINAAGYCKAGPIRSPYNAMPEDFRLASEECGRRWAALNAQHAAGAPFENAIPV